MLSLMSIYPAPSISNTLLFHVDFPLHEIKMPSPLFHFYCSHAKSSLHHIWPEYFYNPTSKWVISNPFPTLQPQSFWWNVNPFLIGFSCLFTSWSLHFPGYGVWNVQWGPQAPRVWTLPARAPFQTPAYWAAFSSKNTPHLLWLLGFCTCCSLSLRVFNSSSISRLHVEKLPFMVSHF